MIRITKIIIKGEIKYNDPIFTEIARKRQIQVKLQDSIRNKKKTSGK